MAHKRDRRLTFEETDDYDVCFVTDEGSLFYTKKQLLTKNSSYFASMFTGSWKEAQTEKAVPVKLAGIPSDILRSILHFLVLNEVAMPKVENDFFSTYFDLVCHSQYFGIPDLEDYLGAEAKDYLVPSNVCLRCATCGGVANSTRWQEAKLYNCTGLQRACEDYLCRNFAKVSQSNNWGSCSREMLKNVLAEGKIDLESSFILESLEMWSRINLYQVGIIPTPEDLHNYIFDLLPPATLFSRENKEYVLTWGMGWKN